MPDVPPLQPSSEAERLSELREFCILDSPPEEAFDDLALLASYICEAPIAYITFIDESRQWFKSKVGSDLIETARLAAFCTHTIDQRDILVVPDASADPRFSANPFVTGAPNIRFYAGAPLLTSKGHALGTLCVIDTVPRELRPEQEFALRTLSQQIVTQLELRRTEAQRKAAEATLLQSHAELERRVEERTMEMQLARAEANAAKREVSQIIERVSDGLVALDTDGRYTYINEKASELLGRRPGELLGKHIWTEFPNSVGGQFHQAYCRAVKEQKTIALQTYDESWDRWFEFRIHPSENGVSVFFQEVTEQKRAEERLDREKRISEAIIESLPGLFYLFDADGRFLRWNRRTEEVTGLTGEQIVTKRPLELIALADRGAVESGIARTFAQGEAATEARILSVTGTSIWHLCSGKRVNINGKACVVGLAVDISERKHAEEQLHDAQARLELAVRASGVGLWDWDIVNERAFVSPEWRAQFGFTNAELPNPFLIWASRLHPEDRKRAVIRLKEYLANPTEEYQSEARLRTNDGGYRWILTRAQILRNEQGQALRMLGCHIDVTQHRQTEERLRQQREQLRALAKHLNSVREEEAGRIARELHDELGAALTGLKMDVSRLGQRLDRDSEDTQRLQIQAILSSIDSTIRSVRKICLDLRPAVLDQLGLSAAMEWLVTEFQKRNGIIIELRQPESVSIDPACAITIFRIIQELLTNISRHAKATQAFIGIRQEPDKVVLEITDNGRGLPADALTRIDRFGLLGVRERVLAVGGKVDFHCPENGGTRVVVCVPVE